MIKPTCRQTAASYSYYIKDHLGSIRIVANSSGSVLQKNTYYAFGGLMSDQCTGDDVQPYKFQGKELDRTMGLEWNDHGARFADMLTARWMTMDPLCEKFYAMSPYLLCGGNMVRNVDKDGKEPTPREAAIISAHVYGDNKVKLIGGWKISNNTFGVRLTDSNTGFKSQLYERSVDGKTEYVYATAGTDGLDGKDWINNLTQPFGLSTQYTQSAENAIFLSEKLSDFELNFTGHSMGGGEAALNSMVTSDNNKIGRKAFTFNAAGLGIPTILKECKSIATSNNIDAYILLSDPLNILQNQSNVMPNVNGKRHYLVPKDLDSVINGHSINNVIKCF